MQAESLEKWIDKNVKWVFAAFALLILVYFGSLFWGFFAIRYGAVSYLQLAVTGALGGIIVSFVKPQPQYKFFFIVGAGLATLLVYLVGQWIGYVHFWEMRGSAKSTGALVASHSILTDFSFSEWIHFLGDSNNYLGLREILGVLVSFYVVQYVASKGRKRKPGDHNFHSERKSRFKRKFDR
jgi:peptidoglycan/LPS O-acetylase OafA/YrhL